MNKKIKVPKFEEEAGFYTTKERSRVMRKIKGKDTKLEIHFRKGFWAKGYRYRKNFKNLIGKPDMLFPKFKVVVFIDGAFWHGYNWKENKDKIKTNRNFWIPKIQRNIQRDKEVNKALEILGYKIFRFWDYELKNDFENCFLKVLNYLNEQNQRQRILGKD